MENYYVFLIFSALDLKKILYYDELIMNDMDFLINKQEFSFASVLIPLIRDGGCPSVLFEVRGSNLSQPGEVCFPGGGIEPFESPLQAAVRETKEELLISEDQLHHISPVGLLPTPSGRLIYAYAAELTGYCGSFSQDEIDFYIGCADKLLFMNELENDYQHDSIMIDYTLSAKLVFEFFISRGIRRIGYFGGTYERNGHVIGRKRVAGLKEKLEQNGLYDSSLFHVGRISKGSGITLMRAASEIPDGILFGDYQTMEGAMEVLKERDEHPVCVLYENFFQIPHGEDAILMIFTADAWMTAFRMLLERLDGSRTQGIHVFCPPRLEIRK